MRASFAIIVSALLAATARAGLVTTTLDFEDGNTIVYSVTTDREGDIETVATVTTIGLGGAATTSATTTTKKGTTTATHTSTTLKGVQGAATTTTADPMHTTTYWYESEDGTWYEATWSASFVVPTVATVVVAEGTVQNYNVYQSSVNSVEYASALVSEAASSGQRRALVGLPGQGVATWSSVAGWSAMFVGMIGAGWGIFAL